MQEIQRMTTRQRHDQQTGKYRELITIAEEVVDDAGTVLEKTSKMRAEDVLAAIASDKIREEIKHYCDLGSKVIDQARRRVLNGEQVPNAEKIYAIFEPHTDLIKRGKVCTPALMSAVGRHAKSTRPSSAPSTFSADAYGLNQLRYDLRKLK